MPTQQPIDADVAIAIQARDLCSESEEHHNRVWFCMTCMMLRTRLRPISDILSVLDDANLRLTLYKGEYSSPSKELAVYHA